MAIDDIVASLRRIPLFADLKSMQITEIGRRGRRCSFDAGDVITMAGEPGDGAYLILSGDAGCRSGPGDQGALVPLEPGSLVGELAMFVEHDYGATVVARGTVDCLKLERHTLNDQMYADPDMARRISDVIRGRLGEIAAQLQVIDSLLMSSIERWQQTPRGLPQALPGQAIADAVPLPP
jgi:CRP-like cAMP-binding protein